MVSVQDSLGAYMNVTHSVIVNNYSHELNASELLTKMKQLSDNGDFVAEIYLINILAHYLKTDMQSLELKRFVLAEGVTLRQKVTSVLLQEQLQKSLQMIQNNPELLQNVSTSDLASILEDSLSFFNESSQTVASAQPGSGLSQIAIDSSKNNMIRCVGSLEGVLKGNLAIYEKERRRRRLSEANPANNTDSNSTLNDANTPIVQTN